MIDQISLPSSRTDFQETHPTLPKMASLFLNELMIKEPNRSIDLPEWINSPPSRSKASLINLESRTDEFPITTERILRISARSRSSQPVTAWQLAGSQNSIRSLVKGISHNFNNLLMGIWGNLSLIRMRINPDDPISENLDEMETLIQDGAYLTHMILGYLGERRIFAQRVRLKQLTKEITFLLKKKKSYSDLIGRLEWTTLSQQPGLVTGSTGIIFEQFLKGIQSICHDIEDNVSHDNMMHDRLNKVQALVNKGLDLTYKMRSSNGNIRLRKRRINPRRLLQHLLKQLSIAHRNISVTHHISPSLPLIMADRQKLITAIGEVIHNGCGAVAPKTGKIEISMKLLDEEYPDERCGVHTLRNCLVVTVKDNGKGIRETSMPYIFEPFFADPMKSSSYGLGLSAARGIVRGHGGHIHVQSDSSFGSVFKIYLPI